MKKILAFETSCDDTSVAVIDSDYHVHSNVISSQTTHEDFGGVVPELASRLHLKNVMRITELALQKANITFDEIDAVAVSINPGLIGALLVGVSFAKSLAYSLNKPLLAVNHMLGHVFANKIENPNLQPPYLALVVSGGHTELVDFTTEEEFTIVGRTRDDAAGEAFDKVAKLLGLGYPGGPIIDRIAKDGDPKFADFPRAMQQKDNFDFSFSGFKTAVRNYLENHDKPFITRHLPDITASVQQAIIDSLVSKTINYAKKNKKKNIIVAGGVSANSLLRSEMFKEAHKIEVNIYFPAMQYCMDNAAMIGAAAIPKLESNDFADLSLNAFSTKGLRII
ncbi:MAG: tRNA (adenosine(37)-N6)-threonylcarbamoyltransferase complex transferase subunit TsaD [Candidatus Cloacimonetes bacterium]|nr:tRNA (adenosine(37)-N6)-threonylcarbamoyltransferase complex transferase subunit TsaD [Candidatus Cloacimonadota bacterium]MCF7812908.1 tRNA (adenosine(37)-N6)-threonylcarbamoyltransferase complex transferase subunit TsaD [Candidatus Cloacimonadota bacterium]MCF7867120.1 tRNA (adenosine(37)-N6)-threonylcarbamoyltransferase complex transferase subunit TsaD [Candidatus Cloacimonadota bacterium]MCF7882560.1 tRNA (adenosine(37)-N6)-threonylcarbamoyltransferase complex transferase subunit TsaD [Ca